MAIVAKMGCWRAEKSPYDPAAEELLLHAVYSDDPASENHKWSKATPSGELRLYITNPDAVGQFEVGKEYLVTITEA